MADLRFDDRVVVVTGAGGGLGRSHALQFGARGARVVVNDLGGDTSGGGSSKTAAEAVVEEIKAAGGQAIANTDSVEHGDRIIEQAMDTYGRIDILVNNAGILRDKTFHKMTEEDWDLVLKVHLHGTYKTTKAAWLHMREVGYGRIVMTASCAGIYGNFGQANYTTAKLAVHGLCQTLALEGGGKGIMVNTIAPLAASRLTVGIMPQPVLDALQPDHVSPLVLWLCHADNTANGQLIEVGGGWYAAVAWERSPGVALGADMPASVEDIAENWCNITDFSKPEHPRSANDTMTRLAQAIGKA
ncbi:MAG: SDR family oxidoreductase [Kordiimonadaceae bacterium]|nr:SDR family oxidoreductase [Kordiimonadaceae bacterium]